VSCLQDDLIKHLLQSDASTTSCTQIASWRYCSAAAEQWEDFASLSR
jgi:hypothetical protein